MKRALAIAALAMLLASPGLAQQERRDGLRAQTASNGDITVAALPRFEPRDECFAAPPEDLDLALDLACGYVAVPEFHNRAGPREIRLGIMRLRSGREPTRAPLFMLAGGPGQTQAQPDFYRLFHPQLLGRILAERDIILMEQRGTRLSDPSLDCPAVNGAAWTVYERKLDPVAADALARELLQSCIRAFKAAGVDLDAYNSVENAADVNAVRAALGYHRIIYYGASYGAQLGQHVMRDFPGILEGVVLDGANPLSRKSWVEDRALDAQWGLDNLTALCRADPKCAATYDISALVDAALALFDGGPLAFTFTDPAEPSRTVPVTVTRGDLATFINGQQGDRIGAMSLPAVLHQLVAGGAREVAQLLGTRKASAILASRNAPPSSQAILMHFAMVCSDDPVHSLDEVRLDGVGAYATELGKAIAEEYVEGCAELGVRELPDTTDVNVATPVPVLLLSGDLDVATPSFRTRELAATLPNATFVVFPGRTHVQIAGINLCAADIMVQFVLDPGARLDTGCTKEAPVLGFVLPDGSVSRE